MAQKRKAGIKPSKIGVMAIKNKIASKAKGVLSAITGGAGTFGKSKGIGRRRRRKSALWFARELARMKLKNRYEKARLKYF